HVKFAGRDLAQLSQREMRRIRGAQIAMILQDPMASLNPLFSIYHQVAEPAYYHRAIRGRPLRERVRELLNAVRIASPQQRMRELFNGAQHPYTRGLLGSMPKLGSKEKLYAIPGQPPDLATLPPGCAFQPRCAEALPRCAEEEPGDTRLGGAWHTRCWLAEAKPAEQAEKDIHADAAVGN